MRMSLLNLLACPVCLGELSCQCDATGTDGDVKSGSLHCAKCSGSYRIVDGIPRFVDNDNYASSFGLQWSRYRSEQIDSVNGFNLSEHRFYTETGWTKQWIKDKWILDAGCGAGRFLDIVSKAGGEVVGVDISNAVDAVKEVLKDRKNVHLVQASIYALPFRSGVFDGCYCIGVIQHTPDPHQSVRSLPRLLKTDGCIALTIYERKPWTHLYSKYWIRSLTRRLPNEVLLRAIQITMPFLFPLTEVAFRVPVLGRLFRFLIPVANYVGCNNQSNAGLSLGQRYRWAVLDTFDMLSPRYDQPQTQHEVQAVLVEGGMIDVQRTAPYALCLAGRKGTQTEVRNTNK
jgi:SAM-dependent methyltransferase